MDKIQIIKTIKPIFKDILDDENLELQMIDAYKEVMRMQV